MEYVLYLDLFFLTDFFLNLLSLFLAAVVLKKCIRMMRMSFAAAVGSAWNCALVLWPMASGRVELLVTVAVVGSLMVAIAFAPEWGMPGTDLAGLRWHIHAIIRADLVLMISSSLLGGCLSLARDQFYLTDWECLVFAGAVTGAIGMVLQNILAPVEIGKTRYSVRLHYQGRQKEFIALADSGNRLRVPETGKPVSLVSYADCVGFCDRISGGFFIPYRAVGTDHGLLFAITFEKMEITKNGMCITIENPAVAIVKESLSSNGDFNMLLPEEYVTEMSECNSRREKSQ